MSGVELGRDEIGELAKVLAANGLSADVLAGAGKRFFAFNDRAGTRVGFGGVEECGGEGLLRSVVAVEGVRGRGFGRAIVEWLVRDAADRGVRRLYLLTMDAPGFFERCGFSPAHRRAVPAVIAETEQFAALCPTTAVCMVRELS